MDRDTISRQDIIQRLEYVIAHGVPNERGVHAITAEAMLEAVKQLPSAQPERIKGQWVEIALSNHTYKCSVCGRLLVNITDGKNNVAKNYPYCHCGADMREVTT